MARTAALTGLQTHTFEQALDTQRNSYMDPKKLFDNLTLVMGKSDHPGYEALEPGQIAAIVRDVIFYANKNEDYIDPIEMHEFCALTGDDPTRDPNAAINPNSNPTWLSHRR